MSRCRPDEAWLGAAKLKNIAMFGGYAFLAGLLLALPVGFLLLCLNLAVGMLSRSAPALNLFAVGLPGQPRRRRDRAGDGIPGDGRLHARHHP